MNSGQKKMAKTAPAKSILNLTLEPASFSDLAWPSEACRKQIASREAWTGEGALLKSLIFQRLTHIGHIACPMFLAVGILTPYAHVTFSKPFKSRWFEPDLQEYAALQIQYEEGQTCERACDSLRIPLYAKPKHPSPLFFLQKRHLHMQVRSK